VRWITLCDDKEQPNNPNPHVLYQLDGLPVGSSAVR